MVRRMLGGLMVAGAIAVTACSSQTFEGTPTNFAGNYTINLTADSNACTLENWKVGDTAQNVGFNITQASGAADMSGTITGVVGGLVKLRIGTDTLTGTAGVGAFTLATTTNDNLSETQDPNCKFQLRVKAEATQTAKDQVGGTITYSVIKTTGTCTTKTVGCTSVQKFNGSRPPT